MLWASATQRDKAFGIKDQYAAQIGEHGASLIVPGAHDGRGGLQVLKSLGQHAAELIEALQHMGASSGQRGFSRASEEVARLLDAFDLKEARVAAREVALGHVPVDGALGQLRQAGAQQPHLQGCPLNGFQFALRRQAGGFVEQTFAQGDAAGLVGAWVQQAARLAEEVCAWSSTARSAWPVSM